MSQMIQSTLLANIYKESRTQAVLCSDLCVDTRVLQSVYRPETVVVPEIPILVKSIRQL